MKEEWKPFWEIIQQLQKGLYQIISGLGLDTRRQLIQELCRGLPTETKEAACAMGKDDLG